MDKPRPVDGDEDQLCEEACIKQVMECLLLQVENDVAKQSTPITEQGMQLDRPCAEQDSEIGEQALQHQREHQEQDPDHMVEQGCIPSDVGQVAPVPPQNTQGSERAIRYSRRLAERVDDVELNESEDPPRSSGEACSWRVKPKEIRKRMLGAIMDSSFDSEAHLYFTKKYPNVFLKRHFERFGSFEGLQYHPNVPPNLLLQDTFAPDFRMIDTSGMEKDSASCISNTSYVESGASREPAQQTGVQPIAPVVSSSAPIATKSGPSASGEDPKMVKTTTLVASASIPTEDESTSKTMKERCMNPTRNIARKAFRTSSRVVSTKPKQNSQRLDSLEPSAITSSSGLKLTPDSEKISKLPSLSPEGVRTQNEELQSQNSQSSQDRGNATVNEICPVPAHSSKISEIISSPLREASPKEKKTVDIEASSNNSTSSQETISAIKESRIITRRSSSETSVQSHHKSSGSSSPEMIGSKGKSKDMIYDTDSSNSPSDTSIATKSDIFTKPENASRVEVPMSDIIPDPEVQDTFTNQMGGTPSYSNIAGVGTVEASAILQANKPISTTGLSKIASDDDNSNQILSPPKYPHLSATESGALIKKLKRLPMIKPQSDTQLKFQSYYQEHILRGPSKHLQVKESTGRGLGVFATKKLAKNQFICEYEGELIPKKEGDKRSKYYAEKHPRRPDDTQDCYIFYIKYLDKPYCVDATDPKYGIGRFINHGSHANGNQPSDANSEAVVVPVDHIPRVVIRATREIPAGTEILYQYKEKRKDILKDFPFLKEQSRRKVSHLTPKLPGKHLRPKLLIPRPVSSPQENAEKCRKPTVEHKTTESSSSAQKHAHKLQKSVSTSKGKKDVVQEAVSLKTRADMARGSSPTPGPSSGTLIRYPPPGYR